MSEKALELLEDELKGFKVEDIKVYYSLGYSQGDGSMVEFKAHNDTHYISVKQYGYYYHEYSFRLDYEYQNNDEVSEDEYKAMYERIVSLNKKLSAYGYDFIEYEISDNDALEFIHDKQLEYLEDGSEFE